MKTSARGLVRISAGLAAGVLLFSTMGCNKLKARDQLNKGVQSYKNARYEEAIEHFKNAVSLDPKLTVGRLYLATAYAQQYIPGADTEENNRMGQAAIDEYKKVLERDPKSINSAKGIAYLYLQMKKFDQSKEFYRKASQLDPNDPEPYYSIGVIDWTQSYQAAAEAKSAIGLKVDDPVKDKKDKPICYKLRDTMKDKIDEGVQVLEKALQLRPDYDDAMAYLNLVYRRRADIQCDDPEARAADLKLADEWVDKTMETKKRKLEKPAGPGGITTEPAKQ